jgi:transmembrane sensor
MDAAPLAPDEQAELDAWLAVDSRHCGALAQASALMVPLNADTVQPQPRIPPARRGLLIGGGMAAAFAGILTGAPYASRLLGEERYRTQVGEMRVVPLRDGSVAYLNTDSEIVVHYSPERRYIKLVRGECLFDVAKNKKRPFIVQAGPTQVRAVGTSFNVKFLPGQPIQVLVREGVVEVKRPDTPVAPPVRLTMNNRAIAPPNAPIVAKTVETVEVGRELAWQVGRLSFHGETLGQAAAEFARYSDIRILIDDPTIAQQRVTGLFVSADPVGFSQAVATSFNLHVEINDRQIRLTR